MLATVEHKVVKVQRIKVSYHAQHRAEERSGVCSPGGNIISEGICNSINHYDLKSLPCECPLGMYMHGGVEIPIYELPISIGGRYSINFARVIMKRMNEEAVELVVLTVIPWPSSALYIDMFGDMCQKARVEWKSAIRERKKKARKVSLNSSNADMLVTIHDLKPSTADKILPSIDLLKWARDNTSKLSTKQKCRLKECNSEIIEWFVNGRAVKVKEVMQILTAASTLHSFTEHMMEEQLVAV